VPIFSLKDQRSELALDICPAFICTSARFYHLQGLGCYPLSQALHAHLPHTTLLNSEDLCIIARERERERGLCSCRRTAA